MRFSELNEGLAYHGSHASFDRFSTDYVGSGMGYQTFGWGLYFTSEKKNAKSYIKGKGGRVIEVRIPDDDLLLDWNKKLPEQSQYVQDKLKGLGYPEIRQRMIDIEYVSASAIETDTGEDIYGVLVCSVMRDVMPSGSEEFIAAHRDDRRKAAMVLLNGGIPGIVYDDVESYSTIRNYVIFDPNSVEIIGVPK